MNTNAIPLVVGVRPSRAQSVVSKLVLAVLTSLLMLGMIELSVRAFVPVHNVGPAFSEHDPVYGKRLRARFTAERTSPDFHFTLRTNSLGMRDPEPTSPLTHGVLFIGDSFTFGYGVEDDEAFPALVRARLRELGIEAPVLNAGLGNSGNGRWLKLLEREAPRWKPRVVVLQMTSNDVGDNLREGLYALEAGALRERPIRHAAFLRHVQRLIEAVPGLPYSHTVGLGWQMTAEGFTPPPKRADGRLDSTQLALTEALVTEAIRRSHALGAQVIGVLADFDADLSAWATALFTARGAICVQAAPKHERPEHYFPRDGHWNARGHRAVADTLTSRIVERLR